MIQNHVISFTKEELRLIHRALLTTQGEFTVLHSVLKKVERTLTDEPVKKEIWPRDWPRDIETTGIT
jgi:DNA-binding response OmpR family regulator